MAGLSAGLLDREIVLQTASVTQSDSGEPITEWPEADWNTVFAQWLPAGSREAWQSQQRLGSYVDGVFRVYDIDPRPTPDTTRVVFQDRVFDVKGVIEIGRGEGLELSVVARAE